MSAAYITGIGAFLPNQPIDNDEIEEVLGLVDDRFSEVKEWVLNYNGIECRYYALDPNTHETTHTNAELTAQAIHNLIETSTLDLRELQCLACGTSSPDQMIPAHACMVHGLLGGPPCEVVSTSAVCCSGMSSLKYAWMSVLSGCSKNAVATGSELASISLRGSHFEHEIEVKLETLKEEPTLAFENDFLRWMLSDGAGALLITNAPREDGLSFRVDWVELLSYAHEAETCMYFGGQKREDGSLHSFRGVDDPRELITGGYLNLAQDVRVLREVLPQLATKAFMVILARHGLEPDGIDWVLPHYSSEGFRDPLHDGLVTGGFDVPQERWFTNLKWKGNTGAASIYIMLEELVSSGRAQRGDRILCFVPESARFSFGFMHLTAV